MKIILTLLVAILLLHMVSSIYVEKGMRDRVRIVGYTICVRVNEIEYARCPFDVALGESINIFIDGKVETYVYLPVDGEIALFVLTDDGTPYRYGWDNTKKRAMAEDYYPWILLNDSIEQDYTNESEGASRGGWTWPT